MKATEQYVHVVLFIMMYKVVLTLSLWMNSLRVTIQMKAMQQSLQASGTVLFFQNFAKLTDLRFFHLILNLAHLGMKGF